MSNTGVSGIAHRSCVFISCFQLATEVSLVQFNIYPTTGHGRLSKNKGEDVYSSIKTPHMAT